MARITKSERAEAIARLRDWIKPGDTVYTILRHVSRSGMQREIGIVLLSTERDGRTVDLHPNHAVATALDYRLGKHDGVIVGGCGMDMGFHLVYELSHTLYPEYRCLGPGVNGRGRCPSNYHVNHHDRVRCPGDCHRVRIYRDPAAELPDWQRTREIVFHATPEFRALDGWQHTHVDEETGATTVIDLPFRYLAVTWGDDEIPQLCHVCGGAGDVANPEGPERWDLTHTDGYALRHRWL